MIGKLRAYYLAGWHYGTVIDSEIRKDGSKWLKIEPVQRYQATKPRCFWVVDTDTKPCVIGEDKS